MSPTVHRVSSTWGLNGYGVLAQEELAPCDLAAAGAIRVVMRSPPKFKRAEGGANLFEFATLTRCRILPLEGRFKDINME